MTKTVFPQHSSFFFNFICNSKSKILRFMIIETVKQDFLKSISFPHFILLQVLYYSVLKISCNIVLD